MFNDGNIPVVVIVICLDAWSLKTWNCLALTQNDFVEMLSMPLWSGHGVPVLPSATPSMTTCLCAVPTGASMVIEHESEVLLCEVYSIVPEVLPVLGIILVSPQSL